MFLNTPVKRACPASAARALLAPRGGPHRAFCFGHPVTIPHGGSTTAIAIVISISITGITIMTAMTTTTITTSTTTGVSDHVYYFSLQVRDRILFASLESDASNLTTPLQMRRTSFTDEEGQWMDGG